MIDGPIEMVCLGSVISDDLQERSAAGILVHGGQRMFFRHPLIRLALHDGIPACMTGQDVHPGRTRACPGGVGRERANASCGFLVRLDVPAWSPVIALQKSVMPNGGGAVSVSRLHLRHGPGPGPQHRHESHDAAALRGREVPGVALRQALALAVGLHARSVEPASRLRKHRHSVHRRDDEPPGRPSRGGRRLHAVSRRSLRPYAEDVRRPSRWQGRGRCCGTASPPSTPPG